MSVISAPEVGQVVFKLIEGKPPGRARNAEVLQRHRDNTAVMSQ